MPSTALHRPVKYRKSVGSLILTANVLSFTGDDGECTEEWPWTDLGKANANKAGSASDRLKIALVDGGDDLVFTFKSRDKLDLVKADIKKRIKAAKEKQDGGGSNVMTDMSQSERWDDSMNASERWPEPVDLKPPPPPATSPPPAVEPFEDELPATNSQQQTQEEASMDHSNMSTSSRRQRRTGKKTSKRRPSNSSVTSATSAASSTAGIQRAKQKKQQPAAYSDESSFDSASVGVSTVQQKPSDESTFVTEDGSNVVNSKKPTKRRPSSTSQRSNRSLKSKSSRKSRTSARKPQPKSTAGIPSSVRLEADDDDFSTASEMTANTQANQNNNNKSSAKGAAAAPDYDSDEDDFSAESGALRATATPVQRRSSQARVVEVNDDDDDSQFSADTIQSSSSRNSKKKRANAGNNNNMQEWMPAPITEEEERSVQSGDGMKQHQQRDLEAPPLVPMGLVDATNPQQFNNDIPDADDDKTKAKGISPVANLNNKQLLMIAGTACCGCICLIVLIIIVMAVQAGFKDDTAPVTGPLPGRIVDDDFYRNNDDDFY